MALEQPEEEGVAEILRKKLALAVKSIQWSYAIFWSISSTKPAGVLEWSNGYYNGDIKTRKTVQSVQVDADQLGLHRTEQLRELYQSLVDAETNPQSTRPSAALSPEDLTDTEWYFLVCMSFEFNIGQGLPGRTLANNKTIWLLNAHCADSKVFSRCLLAKSASVQTVVCFPYSGGVIELGTTELVSEDPNMIQHITTSHLETPRISVSKNCKHVSEATRNEKDTDHYVGLDQDVLDTNLNLEWEEVNTYSTSNNSSNGFEPNHVVKKSTMVERINGGASQVQSWQFTDDEISNGVLNSVSSNDCIPQTFASPEKLVPLPNEEKGNYDRLPDLENCKDTELTSGEILNDDIHYQSIVSTLLKSSNQLIMGACFQSSMKVSSFVRWKNNRMLHSQKSRHGGASQRLLKKVLYEVAKMHGGCMPESQEHNGRGGKLRKSEADETYANRVLAERRRRAKIHEKFVILGSMVPSTSKVDQVSLLDDTIEYLKTLKNRVEELESQKEVQDIEARRRKYGDFVERTSGDYGVKRICNNKKRVMNKRKAFDVNEMEAVNLVQLEDNFTDVVTVSKIEKNVLIEVKCPWREDFLLEIMDAISNLHLDSHSVQSSNIDGNLSLTVKSKVKGSTMASAKMIRQALQRVIRKC